MLSTAGLLFSLNMAILGSIAWRSWTDNNRQFFPFCVAFFHATDAITVLTISCLLLLYFTCLLLKRVLFGAGRLRMVEEEHLREWGWMTASESLLAMTVFRSQFDAGFVVVFAVMLAVKAAHWVCRDRLDLLEQSARLPAHYHLRMVATLALLLLGDLVGVAVCVGSLWRAGKSMAILFTSDFTILLISTASMTTKYCINVYEQRARQQRGLETYEFSAYGLDRSALLFYFDFVVDLCKLSVYLMFFLAIIVLYGLPLHLFREIYLTVASFVKRIQDVVKYRQATENMNTRYPNAKAEDLERVHRLCVVCREEMQVGGPGRCPKVLNCGHAFHFKCLRSWLERQQACPTCRRNVFDAPPPKKSPPAQHSPSPPPPPPPHPPSPSPATPTDHAADRSVTEVKESIQSLKQQMDVLQRNVTETTQLLRSMSASMSGSSSFTSIPNTPINDSELEAGGEGEGEGGDPGGDAAPSPDPAGQTALLQDKSVAN